MQVNKITISDVGRWFQGEDGQVLRVLKVYGALILAQTTDGRIYYPIHDIARRISEEDARRIMTEENMKKPEEIKPKKMSRLTKRVIAVTPKGDERIFESLTLAAAEMGLSQSSISEVCRGNRKTAGGLRWRFEI